MDIKIITNEAVPKGAILLVPPVTLEQRINYSTGEIKEYLKWSPKAGGIITGIRTSDGDEG